MTSVVDLGPGVLLDQLARAEMLTPVDLGVAEAVCRLAGEDDESVRLAVALAARAPRHGHVCIEMDTVADRVALQLATSEGAVSELSGWPDVDEWLERLRASSAVRSPDDDVVAPLVLDGRRLYLDRYWQYERQLEAGLRRLAGETRGDTEAAEVRAWLDRLFADWHGDGLDRQRLAAALATVRPLVVLSGGPGTGKTTTIVRIMALLLATVSREAEAGPLRIGLAAPTGKAAARMQEAVRQGIPELDVDDELRESLEGVSAKTLHRLLGWQRGNATRFRHNAEEPLPYDVVIVDEASMVSLAMMAKLVDAIPDGGRLVLVGDRNQLVSVEAGAVLGDICGGLGAAPGSGRTLQLSEAMVDDLGARSGQDVAAEADVVSEPGIWDSIVQLEHFYRFGSDSGIGNVARAIQRVDDGAGEVIELLRDQQLTDVALVDDSGRGIPSSVRSMIVDGYRGYVEAALAGEDAAGVLERLDAIRVLTPHRRGSRGVRFLNRAIEGWLEREVDGFDPRGAWYLGRPVMITSNDYAVGLFNGDVGVVVRDPEDPELRTAVFPKVEGGIRFVAPSRLPPHETVFAMTVHKSQGSQFDQVVMILPTEDSPILTRELVYTGVTRAKAQVTILGREDLLSAAVRRPVQRASGLAGRLWA